MRTLQKKLFRDLWRLRYQVLTIAILLGCGIASFVAAVSASASVKASRDAFYADAHFADVFVHMKRAPRHVLDRLRDLPGDAAVEGRVVSDFRLVIQGSDEPVVARFVSTSWPENAAPCAMSLTHFLSPKNDPAAARGSRPASRTAPPTDQPCMSRIITP